MNYSKTLLVSLAALLSTIAVNAQPNPFPNAFPGAKALALAEGEATYACHASCGYLILAARACTPSGDSDTGPWDAKCMCTSGSQFMQLVDGCLECGWCLWSDYGSYLTAPLDVCSEPVTPTGVTCDEVKTSYLATADISDISFATTIIATSKYNIATSSGSAVGSSFRLVDATSNSAKVTRSPSTNTRTADSNNVSTAGGSDPITTSTFTSSSFSSAVTSSSSSSTGGVGQLLIGTGSILIAGIAFLI